MLGSLPLDLAQRVVDVGLEPRIELEIGVVEEVLHRLDLRFDDGAPVTRPQERGEEDEGADRHDREGDPGHPPQRVLVVADGYQHLSPRSRLAVTPSSHDSRVRVRVRVRARARARARAR